jgi:hypothetical protein
MADFALTGNIISRNSLQTVASRKKIVVTHPLKEKQAIFSLFFPL